MNILCSLGQKKNLETQRQGLRQISDHIGFIPLVIISPADSLIVEGETRRKFMDSVISTRFHYL
jgi:DNA replication and repair protein RecF